MTPKSLGFLSLLTLLSTALWLVFLVLGMAGAGPLDSFDRIAAYYARQEPLQILGYYNAALVTLLATMLLGGLYLYCKPVSAAWSLLAILFAPVYCTMNLLAYLSQVTLVPELVALRASPEHQAAASVLLRQSLQLWPGALVYFINNLAYAIFGLPSIIFGLLLLRRNPSLRTAGVLLALNGAACILGVVGILVEDPLLSSGSVVGGVLFMLALVPLSLVLLRSKEAENPLPGRAAAI